MFGQTLFAWREEGKRRMEAETEYRPYKCYVEKQMLPIVVCTNNYRIEGMMHITYHHRALDILNGPEDFIPITSAKIYNAVTNEFLAEQDFVAISKGQLVLLFETGKPPSPSPKTEAELAEEAEAERRMKTGNPGGDGAATLHDDG